MSDHAFLPPSGAHSWSKCAAWPSMNERFPQTEGKEATEGTAAHWVAWQLMPGMEAPPAGAAAPNGVTVTDEMLEGGDLLCDTIRERVLDHLMEPHIEERVNISGLLAGTFGTPDCWAVSIEHDRIEIVDYKFGHRFVDEFWNPQGLCYLLGILDILCKKWNIPWSELVDRLTVSFTIVQPRCFYRGKPVRTHTFAAKDARQRFIDLQRAATLTIVHEPVATTNPHCGDCAGRHACSALQLAAYDAAAIATNAPALELSPEAAALELRMLQRAQDLLDARVDGLKEVTLANLRSGKAVPWFRAEQGYGRIAWKVPDDQVIALGQMYGKDLGKPGVITPNQAKKAGIPDFLIGAYAETPQTGIKLIPEDSADAARVFGISKEQLQ